MNKKNHTGLSVLTMLSLLAGCAPQHGNLTVFPDTAPLNASYILGVGDRLQITVYGAGDTAFRTSGTSDGIGQYVVSETGAIDAPFIGAVPASGLTIDQLKQEISLKLAEGYVNNPRVGVDVLAYRPFFILGQVNRPGAYPCTAKARVLSAVALAGGFTYRADETFAYIERKQGDKVVTGRVGPETQILPDDIIRITERYF